MITDTFQILRMGLLLPRRIGVTLAALLVAVLAGCSSGGYGPGSDPQTGNGGGSTGGGGPTGFGTLNVTVTDYFDQPVAGAKVEWYGSTSTLVLISDAEGQANFSSVPSGVSQVCVYHEVRGYTCGSQEPGPAEPVIVPVDAALNVSRQLKLGGSPPIAAVIDTAVETGGLSADGRTLDITIRVAVTQPPRIGSWFGDQINYRLTAAECVARKNKALADLGPRCIRGQDGSDTSYDFGGLIGSPVTRTIDQPARPATVGLLFDQSAPIWAHEEQMVEARLFAAKVFADAVLPDTGLLLAAYAGDDPAANNLSRLPQIPVTFLPEQNPGPFVGRPETFGELDGLVQLSGGVAPLYTAVLSSIDFVADRSIPGTRRVLVVMANGRDNTCGTPAQCRALRDEIAVRARDRNVELMLLARDGRDNGMSLTEEPIAALAVDASAPLIIGYGGYGKSHESLKLVRQLLGESIPVEDVRVRLTSEVPGAFQSGAVIAGALHGFNPNFCPFDCFGYELPFSVRVP